MPDIILHHFDASPFAEKVRLTLGLKDLAWSSVEIPMVMPKPDLTDLTGGYRKTPVMQIGAEVYCDTKRIMLELDARYPEPSLFPHDQRGVSLALSHWSDTLFFEPGAGLSMGMNEGLPEPLLADRKAFFEFMDFDTLQESIPHLIAQYLAQFELLEGQLADGRDYLFGDRPGMADVNAYFPLWMGRGNIPGVGEWIAEYRKTLAWEARMTAIGYGRREDLAPAAALELAKSSTPAAGLGIDADNPEGLEAGERVTVTPNDYGRVPVEGALITLNRREVGIRRSHERVDDVNVHFPRSGYRVERV